MPVPRPRRSPGSRARPRSQALLESLRRAFGFDAAGVLHRIDDGWRLDAASGPAPSLPQDATTTLEIDPKHVLVVTGAGAGADDRPILEAYARELAASLQLEELEAAASTAGSLAAANELRTALLSAVSHDLRTPLAAIKASVTSLLQDDVDWTRGGAERVPRHDRRGNRSPRQPGRQSPGHEQAPDRIGRAARAADQPGRGHSRRTAQPWTARRRRAARPAGGCCRRSTRTTGLLERALANIVANADGLLAQRDGAARRCRSGGRWGRHPR